MTPARTTTPAVTVAVPTTALPPAERAWPPGQVLPGFEVAVDDLFEI
ncbi:MAG TPA: hypothetical protein G4N97_08135 [Thermoflexia bacterium]|nr:hypothetical protein [Thermoflexia bacterium]